MNPTNSASVKSEIVAMSCLLLSVEVNVIFRDRDRLRFPRYPLITPRIQVANSGLSSKRRKLRIVVSYNASSMRLASGLLKAG